MTIPEEEKTVSDASRMESEGSRCTADAAAQERSTGTPEDPFRVAIVGYGLAGATFHAPFIAATPGLRVTAVVTSDEVRAAQARREHPAARVVSSVDALWEDAASLDLVVIASPNRTHAPLAHRALAAGLPIVVDKPFAVTPEDAQRVIEDGERRGLLVTAYHNRRWDGDLLTVRRLLAEGALGRPLRFESSFERWRPVPRANWRESGAPEEAGGLLYDLGSHLVDQALLLFGPVTRVYAELDRRRPDVQVDDDVFLALEHASGVRSHLRASSVAAQPAARLRVLGSEAAYVKHGLDVQEEALRAGRRPGPGWGDEPPSRWGVVGAGDDLTPVRTEAGAWPSFYAGVAAALRGEAPPPVDPRDAVAGLEVIAAAQRSAATGETVRLP